MPVPRICLKPSRHKFGRPPMREGANDQAKPSAQRSAVSSKLSRNSALRRSASPVRLRCRGSAWKAKADSKRVEMAQFFAFMSHAQANGGLSEYGENLSS